LLTVDEVVAKKSGGVLFYSPCIMLC